MQQLRARKFQKEVLGSLIPIFFFFSLSLKDILFKDTGQIKSVTTVNRRGMLVILIEKLKPSLKQ